MAVGSRVAVGSGVAVASAALVASTEVAVGSRVAVGSSVAVGSAVLVASTRAVMVAPIDWLASRVATTPDSTVARISGVGSFGSVASGVSVVPAAAGNRPQDREAKHTEDE